MNLTHTSRQYKILAVIRAIDVLSILLQTEVSQQRTKMAAVNNETMEARSSPFFRSVIETYTFLW